MPTIQLTKEKLVCNLFTGDTYFSTLLISNEQFEKVRAFPDYHAWQYDDCTDTFTLIPILSEQAIRHRRQTECFNLIDAKSRLWWDSLSSEDYTLIKNWYKAWLDAPATKIIPELPESLK
jgi:hypothetical protein